jgi:antirestriction protein
MSSRIATDDTPRVYVACLASYNNGRLHGRWIDATDADDMRDAVSAMLAESPTPGAEEWAIHDYEHFEGLKFGESADFDNIAMHAAMLAEHGGAWAAYVDWVYESNATADDFQDRYCGEYRTAEEYAEELVEDCGMLSEMPENLRCYFDFERFARDLNLSGDYHFAEGGRGVYVFRSC